MENKIIKDLNNLKSLLPKTYKGYIWMVSHKKPCIYQDEKIDFAKLEYGNPVFNKIQEAYLFDGTNSIHIKNIDGKELFFVHSDNNFNKKEKYFSKEMEFPSHINTIKNKNLKFTQIYKLEASLSGTTFKTYQPIVRLFKGFSNPKNN